MAQAKSIILIQVLKRILKLVPLPSKPENQLELKPKNKLLLIMGIVVETRLQLLPLEEYIKFQ